jgi:hypothetical protein
MTETHQLDVDEAVPPVRPAHRPVAAAGASRIAILLAIGVVAVGIVCLREAFVAAGWVRGPLLAPEALRLIDGLTPGAWVIPAAVVCAVFGLAAVVTALAPRKRTAHAASAETPIYVPYRDVAILAAESAKRVPGVLAARARASTRRIVVRCTTTGGDGTLRRDIADALARDLSLLARPPRLVVRTTTVNPS